MKPFSVFKKPDGSYKVVLVDEVPPTDGIEELSVSILSPTEAVVIQFPVKEIPE